MTAGASVLVVDDDPVIRSMLTASLQASGHRVTTAESGSGALDLVRAEGFDVVLLDVLMPGMNGDQVLEQLKGDPRLRHIPVVMVTGLEDVGIAVRCIELGADDYLPKPIDPVLLGARINAGLMKKRLHDLELRARRGGGRAQPPTGGSRRGADGRAGSDRRAEEVPAPTGRRRA